MAREAMGSNGKHWLLTFGLGIIGTREATGSIGKQWLPSLGQGSGSTDNFEGDDDISSSVKTIRAGKQVCLGNK